jgi:hypothetical protein
MIGKNKEKQLAIKLRKEGKTYREIMGVVPVAKSSISLWLKEVGLSKAQKQSITAKRIAGQRKGADARRSQRIERHGYLFNTAKAEIGSISDRELFLIGTVLYWAEGNKEKDTRPGTQYLFGNMDPKMLIIIIAWLEQICKIPKSMIVFELYLHKSSEHRLKSVLKYWEDILGLKKGGIAHVYYKNNTLKPTNRKNVGDTYFGLIRLRVPQSSDIVRKVAGWTEGVTQGIDK